MTEGSCTRRDADNVQIIIEYCQRIEDAIQNVDEDDFLNDYVVQSSCAFSTLQIGEAVKRLSIGFSEKHAEVSWNKIARFRDMLAHQYGNIDLSTVWDISSRLVPELKTYCEEILNGLA